MQKLFIFLAFASFIAIDSEAQQFAISGIIKDNTGKPVEIATVSLLKASDSSWVQSGFTDDNGAFDLKNVVSGAYIIDVYAAGHNTTRQNISVTNDARSVEITLQQITSLKEVTVTDKKPFIEQGMGKTIINLSSSVTAVGTNVLDLLRKSPGITVDMNGNITMQGKQGVLVLIDNKETYLTGQQLADYLRTLSGSEVAQLELITQPSARYDAEGNAGIINIKTKKNKKQGWNGVANASYKQGIYPGTINSLSIEHTKNKLHVNASYAFLHMTGFENINGWRNIKDEQTGSTLYHFGENSFLIETFEDHKLKFGADYKLSDKSTINGSITGIYHTNSEHDYVNSAITDATNNLTHNNAFTQRGFIRHNIIANIGYMHDFNKDHSITVIADYLNRDENNYDNTINTGYDAFMHPVGADSLMDLYTRVIDAYTFRADYTGQLKNNIKVEAGAKSSYVTNRDKSTYVHSATQSDQFSYHENINALYVTVSKNVGKKLETQAGLRCENSNISGTQQANLQEFTNSKTDLFPTVFVAYTLNDKNRFELNYGRRITRPSYLWLNPLTRYLSQYYYEVGNPGLQPEYSNNIELKHTYHNNLTTTCSYSHSEGVAGDIMHIQGNTEYKTVENIALINEFGLGITYSAPLYKWWSLSASGSIYAVNFIGSLSTHNFNISGTRSYFHMNNQFSFQNNWAAELGYFYAGNNIEGFMTNEGPRQWLSLGWSKKMFRDTTVIRLSIDDPFNAYVYAPANKWYNLDSYSASKWDNQQINISVTYNFGKNLNKQKGHDASEEQSRMGM